MTTGTTGTTRWRFFSTGDGSPTLAHTDTEIEGYAERNTAEPMHSAAGALAETEHVYGPLATALLHGHVAQRAVVVGLGLGYIERVLAARFLVLQSTPGATPPKILLTFESDSGLREGFLDHVYDRRSKSDDTATRTLRETHAEVCRRVSSFYGLPADAVRRTLLAWREEGRLVCEGALDTSAPAQIPSALSGFGALFFDAYSARTSAGFWSPSFLDALLAVAAPKAGVATYAARGVLTRALRAHGFAKATRPGYGNKRECTLALRGKDI